MRTPIIIIAAALLTGCVGTRISTVMSECPKSMPGYVDCVKERYSREGRRPNASEIRSLYLELDSIKEMYLAGKVGEAEAVAMADKARRVILEGEGRPRVVIID
jgi:hypothetical protein